MNLDNQFRGTVAKILFTILYNKRQEWQEQFLERRVEEKPPFAEPPFARLPRLPVKAVLLEADAPSAFSQSVPPAEDVKKYYFTLFITCKIMNKNYHELLPKISPQPQFIQTRCQSDWQTGFQTCFSHGTSQKR
jgi:hypothetical protein